ncbi:MAG TPA: hypothetical protein VFJ90_13985, partial [Candidatus Didemnitutus sp.]|nr:hypothetical protein [Candidatus Didemnitutus sp.]
RNVALSLLCASAGFILCHLLWSDRRRGLIAFAAWGAGAAIGLGPFVVRNVVAFGALNGYHMPPSELPWHENVRDAVATLVIDTTGSGRLGGWVSQPAFLVALAVMALAVAVTWLITRQPAAWREFVKEHRVPLFCVAWAVAHLAIVVAARSTYRWGETIVSRHTMQTYWLLWIATGLGLLAVLPKIGLSRIAARYVVAACFALLAARQVHLSIDKINETSLAPNSPLRFDQNLRAVLQHEVTPNQIVLAHGAHLLRIHCDVNARKIPEVRQYYKLARLTREHLRQHGESGLLWGIVIADHEGVQRGMNDELIRDIVNRPHAYPEFERIPIDGPAIVLKYVRPMRRALREDSL